MSNLECFTKHVNSFLILILFHQLLLSARIPIPAFNEYTTSTASCSAPFVFQGTEDFVVKCMSVLHSVVILGGKDPTSELSWRYGVDGVCANDVGVVRFDGNDIEILPIEVSL